MDILILNSQIDAIEPWIHRAAEALLGFYNEATGTFWLDNEMKKSGSSRIHPTATNRSFIALSEYLRFLDEHSLEMHNSRTQTIAVLQKVALKFLNDPKIARNSPDNKQNMFTDSHYIFAVAALDAVQPIIQCSIKFEDLTKTLGTIIQNMAADLIKWKGGRVISDDENHDFVTLYAVRTLDIYYWLTQDSSNKLDIIRSNVVERINNDVLKFLAFHSAKINSKFDAPELAFSLSLLNRFPSSNSSQLTYRAIEVILESQSPSGSFATSRLVSYSGKGLLHVASYEVALAITYIFFIKLKDGDISIAELILPVLERAFELIKVQFESTESAEGWANDHARRMGLVESWVTAIVLTFLIHYHEALVELRQYYVLSRYEVEYTDKSSSLTGAMEHWPDLLPMFQSKIPIDLKPLDTFSDPTDDGRLIGALKEKVVEPIAKSWIHRPAKVGLLFYGLPGTRKTSLSRRLGTTLGWPMLILSPPAFLRNGLEGLEARAAEIFNNLSCLRRVVVLFDECEEFFKKRPKTGPVENRTIGAFITSGMLPRLQALRDSKWTIFILATNTTRAELDDAVTRLGRFDFVTELPLPSLQAQLRYLSAKYKDFDSMTQESIQKALEECSNNSTCTNTSSLTFSVVDELIEIVKESSAVIEVEKLVSHIQNLAQGPPSLV